MALMKTKFTRGGQPIPMRVGKKDYIFQPNVHGDFVADITAEDHVHYLETTGNFELYIAPSYEEMMEAEKARAKKEAKSTKKDHKEAVK